MLKWYFRVFNSRPLLTQCIISGLLGVAGDAISQIIVERRAINNYDIRRSGRFLVISSVYIAPSLAKWYKILELVKGNAKLLPLKRMVIDQTVFSPPFTASTLYNLRLLEGQRFSKAFEALKRDFPDIFLTGIKFWPFILLLNFYFIPLNFRVIFVQIAALLWNAYFSYRTQLCAGLYPDVY